MWVKQCYVHILHEYNCDVQSIMQGTASTLTRTEVRGGGRKPYAQKGTGNARRGSNTSPLFPGGGVSFGPKVRQLGKCTVERLCMPFVVAQRHTTEA